LVSASSSIGVFGGLGGGGGPAFAAVEGATNLDGGTGAFELAYLPASTIGGGALNLNAGRGGDGVRSGDLEGDFGDFAEGGVVWLSTRLRRAGGKAGAGPLFDESVLPVFCGLMLLAVVGGGAGGGGGGALPRLSLPTPFDVSSEAPFVEPSACLCSI